MPSIQTTPRALVPLSEDEAYQAAQGLQKQARYLRTLMESEVANGHHASAEWTGQCIAICEALAIRLQRFC